MSLTINDIGDLSYVKKVTFSMEHNSWNTITAKCGDRNSRFLEITFLSSRNEKLSLPDGAVPRIRCTKPDGTYVLNDGFVYNGKAYVELTEQVLAAAGRAEADVAVYKDDALLSSANFYINVEELPYDENGIVSSDEFSALENALETVGEITEYQAEVTELQHDTNVMFNVDFIRKELNIAHSIDKLEGTVSGTWQNITSEPFTLPQGIYTLITSNIEGVSVTVEYVGGRNDTSLRLATLEGPGHSSFIVSEDLELEVRYLVTGGTSIPVGTYGVYNILIAEGELNVPLLDDVFTGVSSKVAKVYGRNLFDKNSPDIEYGKYLDSYGVEIANEKYYVSGFIPVKPNTSYALHNWDFGGGYLVFYSNLKISLKGYSISGNNAPADSVFTTPADCYYIRFTGLTESIGTNQLEEGSVLTAYQPYTDFLPLTELEARVDELEGSGAAEQIFSAARSSFTDGQYINLGKNLDIKKNKTAMFYGNITSFSGLRIGHGETGYSSSYVDIDSQNITVYEYLTSAKVVHTAAHGLTMTGFISVIINVGITADITVTTASGSFTLSGVRWDGCNSIIYAKCIGSSLTDCMFKWTCSDLNTDVWVMGDSYLGLTSDERFPYYLLEQGCSEWLACAYPGRTSADALASVQRLLTVGKPRYIVWCMGMNDPDDGEIDANWLASTESFISLCDSNKITPILATIPSAWGSTSEDSDIVVARDNTYKNAWVQSSSRRYVDLETAVGADSGSGWYDGMLSEDGIHPTALGAKALAARFIIDVPELALHK